MCILQQRVQHNKQSGLCNFSQRVVLRDKVRSSHATPHCLLFTAIEAQAQGGITSLHRAQSAHMSIVGR